MSAIKAKESLPEEPFVAGFSCFVLRLWTNTSDRMYGYLLDARTGVKHPLHDLSEIPDIIRTIIAESS